MSQELTFVEIDRRHAPVTVVRLNRPDRLNALSASMMGAITSAFSTISRDRETAIVVLTGAGRGFCAGADLKAFGTDLAPDTDGRGQAGVLYRLQQHLADAILAVHECEKPVVAAVHGAAVGGGLAFALAADVCIATPSARFGSQFIRVGLSSCDAGVSYLLPRAVGTQHAARLMLTGEQFSGEHAHTIGMVSELAPEDDVVGRALEVAELMAANSEYGLFFTKKGLQANVDAPSLRHAMEIENRTQVLGAMTGVFDEAVRAFASGGAPRWPVM